MDTLHQAFFNHTNETIKHTLPKLSNLIRPRNAQKLKLNNKQMQPMSKNL